MAKQKTGGRKRGAQQDYHGTTSAAPAVAPGAGALGPQYLGLRTMVLQELRTPVQCQFQTRAP
jgi:hypothetical protein